MTSDLNGAQGGAKAFSRIIYETGAKSQDETRTLADWQKKLLEAKEKYPDASEDTFSVDVEYPAAHMVGEVVPAYDRDMAEQAAKAQGYPVLEGVQYK